MQKAYIRNALEVKQFFLHEIPNFYYDLGRNMGINFSETEMNKDQEVLSRVRERGTQEIFNMSRQMGLDNVDSDSTVDTGHDDQQ